MHTYTHQFKQAYTHTHTHSHQCHRGQCAKYGNATVSAICQLGSRLHLQELWPVPTALIHWTFVYFYRSDRISFSRFCRMQFVVLYCISLNTYFFRCICFVSSLQHTHIRIIFTGQVFLPKQGIWSRKHTLLYLPSSTLCAPTQNTYLHALQILWLHHFPLTRFLSSCFLNST